MSRTLKIILSLAATLIVILFAFGIISYSVLEDKIPEYNGERVVSGITNDVQVYRDSFAIPYIIADNELDAIFALGYIHAQERLFQMDMTRRAGEGRLSEVLGSKTIPFDKMFRTLGVYKVACRDYEKLNSLSKRYLEAYSNGVNAYIKDADGNLTFEFDILGYDPYPWKPEHSLVLAKLLAWELNIGWWTDIAFSHLVQKLGAEKVAEIIPDFDENAPTIIPSKLNKVANIPTGLYQVDKQFREFTGFVGTHIGSNNWVVNKEKSESGDVLIANDPHLAFQAPGKFMFVVIRSDSLNGEGFTAPGLPAFIIGKNQNIAWVLTNVMADDSDFYLEKLDSTKTHYLLDGEWKALDIVSDTIVVKDSASVIYDIAKTHRGPIISGIHPYDVLYKNKYQDEVTLSMRWTALDFTDEVYTLVSVNKAKNWNDFTAALKHFVAPGQNFVYGDDQGNIGYVCAARLPLRTNNSPTMVYDGTTTEHDWKGFVPFSKMPKLFNPPQNYIASANNKTIRDFPYHISNLWEPASRIKRITELLTSKEKHSIEDFKKYQMDFYSFYAKSITEYVVQAFEGSETEDENLKLAVDLLSKWDYIMDKQSQTPTIYEVFFQRLMENIFMDEMGKELFSEYIFVANVPFRKVQEMLKDENSSWWDNVNTDKVETKDEILRQSLTEAVKELEEKFGNNVADWQWRNLHTVTFAHPFSSASPLLAKVLDIGPYPISGDGTTVFNTEYGFNSPYKSKLGPALRFLFDFSKPDEVNFILTTGEAGYFMSDHYDDMTEMWLNGKYIKVNINTSDISSRGFDLLQLKKE